MGNSSPMRAAIRNDDMEALHSQLKEAGDGSPDLINEDYSADCLCERTRNIQSPLHTCVAKRKPEMVELLLQYGADVSTGGRNGMTALHYAAKNGDLPTCRMLVKYGAQAGAEDNQGQITVHHAAASCWAESNGKDDVLRYLIEDVGKAEDVNHKDVDEWTPLHVAARWGYVRLARYLVDKGADRSAKTRQGRTPLEEAALQGNAKVMGFLAEEKGAREAGEQQEKGEEVEMTEEREQVKSISGEQGQEEEKPIELIEQDK